MRLDKYSNPIFNEQDLFDALYKGHKFNPADLLFVEHTNEVWQLEEQVGFKFAEPIDALVSPQEFDNIMQHEWNMPDEYKQMDIVGFLVNECPKQNYQRLMDELEA